MQGAERPSQYWSKVLFLAWLTLVALGIGVHFAAARRVRELLPLVPRLLVGP